MKNLKIITTIALILCILVFLLTITDFMALHDIRNDYVSKKAIEHFEIANSGDLPDWTNTPMEWQLVKFNFVSRFLFFIFNIVVFFLLIRKFRQQKQH